MSNTIRLNYQSSDRLSDPLLSCLHTPSVVAEQAADLSAMADKPGRCWATGRWAYADQLAATSSAATACQTARGSRVEIAQGG